MRDANDSEPIDIEIRFKKDFASGSLSEREAECLRAFLPGLIMELIQTGSLDEEEE